MEQYKIGIELGRGSTGIVYLATYIPTDKQVVAKLIPKSILRNARRLEMAEAEYLVPKFLGCSHKNIVCVLDRVQDKEGIWIISEYVANATTLNRYIPGLFSREDRLELLNIFYQLADGLVYMHEQGIVHGDIKPENILLKGQIPFYIDFDLSCSLPSSKLRVPCPTAAVRFGTPYYMAPEIINKRVIDRRTTDIWALGITFYEIIAGDTPFHGRDAKELFNFVLTTEPPKIDSQVPALNKLILHMLEKSPENRPVAEELRNTLEDIIKSI